MLTVNAATLAAGTEIARLARHTTVKTVQRPIAEKPGKRKTRKNKSSHQSTEEEAHTEAQSHGESHDISKSRPNHILN